MNLPWKPDVPADVTANIIKRAIPREPLSASEDVNRWKNFTRGLGTFYQRYIRGWTWEQIDRFREAKLREIESANEERSAAAHAKFAEARKLDAEAELVFYEAEKKKLENLERQWSLSQNRHSSLREHEPSVEQWDELRLAIEAIESKGGKVILPEPGQLKGRALNTDDMVTD